VRNEYFRASRACPRIAYLFVLRHVADADHIAATDDTVRCMLPEGKRHLGGGNRDTLCEYLAAQVHAIVCRPTNALECSTRENRQVLISKAMTTATPTVSALTWAHIQRLYDSDAAVHLRHCEADGLECPQEVFAQLFHAEANNADFAGLVRAVDWGRVRWGLTEFSGVALRQMLVDRRFQRAVDEARQRAEQFRIRDDRPAVVAHWQDAGTWIVPPVIAAGDVLGSSVGYELLVGCTRLGNLLGLLDREEIPEAQRHLLWVGRWMETNETSAT